MNKMLESLHVSNFRGLSKVETTFGRTSVLLGPNNSGKTMLLHAIRFACMLARFSLEARFLPKILENNWIQITDNFILQHDSLFITLSDWKALFVNQYVKEGTSSIIRLVFSKEDKIQELTTEITIESNEQLKTQIRFLSSALHEIVKDEQLSENKKRMTLNWLEEHMPQAVFIPPFYGTILREEYNVRVVIDRKLGSGDQHNIVRNLVSSLSAIQFERLNSFLQEILQITLSYRTSGDALQTESPLRILFKEEKTYLELSAGGAGLVNLVALYAALSRKPNSKQVLFLLDEPEAHLSPKIQAKSSSQIAQLVMKEFNAQLILATHSVSILNQLFEDGATLFRIDRNATPNITQITNDSELFNDLAQWVDLTPYSAINFLASRRILFCEGKTDRILLSKLGNIYYRNQPYNRRKFNKWHISQLNGTGNKPISKLLDRLLQNDVIKTSPNPFKIVVVLDRDYERTPGKDKTNSHIELVWSKHSIESLFLTVPILYGWLRAFLKKEVQNLRQIIDEVIHLADENDELLKKAIEQMHYHRFKIASFKGENFHKNYGEKFKAIHSEAENQVLANPEIWQRGKDRATFILDHIRKRLPTALQSSFPTKLENLIQRTNANKIGIVQNVVPDEMKDLFLEML